MRERNLSEKLPHRMFQYGHEKTDTNRTTSVPRAFLSRRQRLSSRSLIFFFSFLFLSPSPRRVRGLASDVQVAGDVAVRFAHFASLRLVHTVVLQPLGDLWLTVEWL